jgi:uncharacterized protein YggE
MPEHPHIVVTGIGVASGTPDQCGLQVSINHMAASAAEALSATAELVANAIAGLAEISIDQCEARTLGFSVQDFFDQEQQKFTARVASYQLHVLVQPIDGVGEVLAALTSIAGDGLQVRGMQLTILDPEPLKSEARRLAVQDAKRKAVELSDEAGVRLGALLSIQDGYAGLNTAPFVRAMPMATGFSATNLPIEAGDISEVGTVSLTYAIEE